MHYYQFNIGDYKSHTAHLDWLEDLAYRRLLDLYYLHERPLNACSTTVARQLGMRDYEEQIKLVLQEFFILSDAGWTNTRADKEIASFRAKSEQASRAGKASAESRSNGRSTPVQRTFNQTRNNKQETLNIKHKTITKVTTPPNVAIEVWDSFVEQRKLSKATISQTVINSFQREADKAGWTLEQALSETVARGWRGFKAEWVKDKPQAQPLKSFRQMDEERSKERYNQMVGRSTSRVIDITPDNFLEITDAAPKSH
jgi:uncharacterized protein YdaU (DUF1376 family)